jgi:ankyrin repeat protein
LNIADHDKVSFVSPIVEAIRCGSKAMFILLLDAGIEFNTSTQRKTSLLIALIEGHLDIVELLIIHGANINGDETAR